MTLVTFRVCFFYEESAVVPRFHDCPCKHLPDGIPIAKYNYAILNIVRVTESQFKRMSLLRANLSKGRGAELRG